MNYKGKRHSFLSWIMKGFLWMLLLLTAAGTPAPVKAAPKTCQVTYYNIEGTGTGRAYQSLNESGVPAGSYITIPEVPKKSGYQGIGWSVRKGKKIVSYEPGDKVKVTKDMKLYGVRRESYYYTVSFYLGDGSSNEEYEALTRAVEEGDYIRLPQIPSRPGFKNLGWSRMIDAAAAKYPVNTKFTVRDDMTFYSVQSGSLTVSFYDSAGKVLYFEKKVQSGHTLKLPGILNKNHMTMMGWSEQKKQSAAPQYEVGETISVVRPMTLYAVKYRQETEPEVPEENLSALAGALLSESGKFSRIIFVGDSRFYNMYRILEEEYGSDSDILRNIYFITKSGSTLRWLRETAAEQLMDWVQPGTAVIFNHGINDLPYIDQYVSFMKNLGEELKASGCTLYYMSINPVNNKNVMSFVKDNGAVFVSRPEETVREFNRTIEQQLCRGGDYTYLDIYTYLMKTGYTTAATASTKYGNTGLEPGAVDDGLHYGRRTYERIFEFCMGQLYADAQDGSIY